jgi:hypothetical protein
MSPNLYYNVVYQLFLTLYFTYYNDVRSHEWDTDTRPSVCQEIIIIVVYSPKSKQYRAENG